LFSPLDDGEKKEKSPVQLIQWFFCEKNAAKSPDLDKRKSEITIFRQ
jgi:hypothetical protein